MFYFVLCRKCEFVEKQGTKSLLDVIWRWYRADICIGEDTNSNKPWIYITANLAENDAVQKSSVGQKVTTFIRITILLDYLT